MRMKDYKWTLSRKYPFVVKRPLTQLEIIHKRMMEAFNLIPIVYIVGGMIAFYGFLKYLVKR